MFKVPDYKPIDRLVKLFIVSDEEWKGSKI